MINQPFKLGLVAVTTLALLFSADSSLQAAALTWTNHNSGGWNITANWNPNSVPALSDTVIITNPDLTVSHNSATTVGGILLGTNGAGRFTLSLAGCIPALNGPLTVNQSGSFTVDSGALIGNTNAGMTRASK